MDSGHFLILIGKLAAVLGIVIWLIKEIGIFMLKKSNK